MHRFFIDKDCITGNSVLLPPEVSVQILKVLRMRVGDKLIVLDGLGWEYHVKLIEIHQNNCIGTITTVCRGEGEPSLSVTMFQSLIKYDKFEWALQKGVEIGVTRFVPIVPDRLEVSIPSETRVIRWTKIIKEASEQSHRSIIPKLLKTMKFEDAVTDCYGTGLILNENEKTNYKRIIRSGLLNQVSVFVGPVGGFTEKEIKYAVDHSVKSVSLGYRILRSETAGLVAVSNLMYESGDIG
jgi:16S rRNA (uracil1498-N3)-methyltransferase